MHAVGATRVRTHTEVVSTQPRTRYDGHATRGNCMGMDQCELDRRVSDRDVLIRALASAYVWRVKRLQRGACLLALVCSLLQCGGEAHAPTTAATHELSLIHISEPTRLL